jgi:hypothetical protein
MRQFFVNLRFFDVLISREVEFESIRSPRTLIVGLREREAQSVSRVLMGESAIIDLRIDFAVCALSRESVRVDGDGTGRGEAKGGKVVELDVPRSKRTSATRKDFDLSS